MTHDESNHTHATQRCDTCLRRRRAEEAGWREIELSGGATIYRCPACEAKQTTVQR